jgi:hypothetical protein
MRFLGFQKIEEKNTHTAAKQVCRVLTFIPPGIFHSLILNILASGIVAGLQITFSFRIAVIRMNTAFAKLT